MKYLNTCKFQVKVVVTLSGDVISHADINLKLPRPAVGKDLYSNTSILELRITFLTNNLDFKS